MNQHIGSDFDDFLSGQGTLEEATAIATQRVLSWQSGQARLAKDVAGMPLWGGQDELRA